MTVACLPLLITWDGGMAQRRVSEGGQALTWVLGDRKSTRLNSSHQI